MDSSGKVKGSFFPRPPHSGAGSPAAAERDSLEAMPKRSHTFHIIHILAQTHYHFTINFQLFCVFLVISLNALP